MAKRPLLAFIFSAAVAVLSACADSSAPSGPPQRSFPQSALRGAVVVGIAPEITLNGRPSRMAPGGRIRDANNMSLVPSAVVGGRYLVHYTVEPTSGMVKDVWILTPDEASRRWPTTTEEAQKWSFDPVAQTWTRP